MGTGKGVVARAIHDLSRRASRAFVDVQCAAIPWSEADPERLGSGTELPRHTAVTPRWLAAKGGTLFLDGVEALPLDAQDALLAILEPNSARRFGGGRARPLDVSRRAAPRARALDALAAALAGEAR
jgi:DNA-binding NtrC family response regulator